MKLLGRNVTQIQHILWIYLMAFILMAFNFSAHAKEDKKDAKSPVVTKEDKKSAKTPVVAKDVKKRSKNTVVVMDIQIDGKSAGKIEVKLDNEKAPISTENFLKYVDDKFYDGTIFHRVIPSFMVQGGGMTPDMKEKTTRDSIKNEAKNGLSNKRGTLAMARTNVVDSASSQFFINVVDNERLDYKSDAQYGYAVFGEVTKGMDVVDKIKAVETAHKGEHDDVPVKTVLIKSMKRK